ncbi:methylenetetrahydrofolate reductase [Desulfosarcina ovata]|uniref:Methylenetetrahydrofolate reductase n=1 Tax=Desulfosarcina ovata subsp. ovata TaxID=2752305 RepID=A0A5K8AB61_9BACT|nr:methylenetetrahydrofolate reductase [Desulfosarcina ovata]BBO89771.1 5,10-methylenetetrahydrofolate reductase [Desulfosarcina ovata subsp. ovata]
MHLKNKFDVGKFAILAEMQPPKGVNVSTMVNSATRVRKAVDAFLVSEMGNAVMRMSALGGAMILQSRGMETIMQANCRDRNRIALQADLLAAYGCGIINVMGVAGEDPSLGDHHQTKAVHDIDLMTLYRAIAVLQTGKDLAGNELSGAPDFFVGGSVNARAAGDELENVLARLNEKIDAGVNFFIAPPVYDVGAFAAFMEKVDLKTTRIIPTVMLLKSVGMARYLDRHLNVTVSQDLIKRMMHAPDKATESLAIAAETIKAIKEAGFAGVLISAMGWEDKLEKLVDLI